jgi:hypothetical protein
MQSGLKQLRMTFLHINYSHEFKKKMPVNFLTDWHYHMRVHFKQPKIKVPDSAADGESPQYRSVLL